MTRPERQIRACYGPETIRVYQAFGSEIADSALERQTFVSPPFSMSRMTWIKPSFLWMMYRSGWARKDPGQARILGIDITHEGFAWAIGHSCPSHPEPAQGVEEWRATLARSPVRVQWDPERDIDLQALPWRTIQIGLSGEAVERYVTEWIRQICDMTALANQIANHLRKGERGRAEVLLPREDRYEVGMDRGRFLAIARERLLDPGHYDHEEIISLLQDHPEEANISYLMKAIQLKPRLDYLDYDDYGSYYKKCLWALRAIDTPAAIDRIKECAESAELPLRKEALYRLKRIREGG
jgi:hypothetical protein